MTNNETPARRITLIDIPAKSLTPGSAVLLGDFYFIVVSVSAVTPKGRVYIKFDNGHSAWYDADATLRTLTK